MMFPPLWFALVRLVMMGTGKENAYLQRVWSVRWSFDDLWQSILTVFMMITGDSWIDVVTCMKEMLTWRTHIDLHSCTLIRTWGWVDALNFFCARVPRTSDLGPRKCRCWPPFLPGTPSFSPILFHLPSIHEFASYFGVTIVSGCESVSASRLHPKEIREKRERRETRERREKKWKRTNRNEDNDKSERIRKYVRSFSCSDAFGVFFVRWNVSERLDVDVFVGCVGV